MSDLERAERSIKMRGAASYQDVSVKIVPNGEGFGVETTVKGDRRYPIEDPMPLEEAQRLALAQLVEPRASLTRRNTTSCPKRSKSATPASATQESLAISMMLLLSPSSSTQSATGDSCASLPKRAEPDTTTWTSRPHPKENTMMKYLADYDVSVECVLVSPDEKIGDFGLKSIDQ